MGNAVHSLTGALGNLGGSNPLAPVSSLLTTLTGALPR